MKCKDCDCCRKGWFKSKPDAYVCIGVKEPFIISSIDKECTEYEEKRTKTTYKITYKEAINHFKYGITHDIFKDPVISYATMAIEALEKQIPKKPIELGDGRFCCPVCRSNNRALGEYCDKCGQKINWKW